jgi:hypothetical protein
MRKTVIISSLAFLLIGCGGSGTGSTTSAASVSDHTVNTVTDSEVNMDNSIIDNMSQTEQAFAYKTQRNVRIDIELQSNLRAAQRQILIFQHKKHDDSLELDLLDGLIASSVIGNDGYFSQKFTMANHIQSVWIVIPALGYEKKINIDDNAIDIVVGGRS